MGILDWDVVFTGKEFQLIQCDSCALCLKDVAFLGIGNLPITLQRKRETFQAHIWSDANCLHRLCELFENWGKIERSAGTTIMIVALIKKPTGRS
jgi:hypothetical protein